MGADLRPYERIVCLLPLSAGLEVGERARSLATAYGAELWLLGLVEYSPLPMTESGLPDWDPEVLEALMTATGERLEIWARRFQVGERRRIVRVGARDAEILDVVKAQRVDLLVLGGADLDGLGRGLIHRLPCEVLVVD